VNSSTIAEVWAARSAGRLITTTFLSSPLTATSPISGARRGARPVHPHRQRPTTAPVAGVTRTTAACAPEVSWRPYASTKSVPGARQPGRREALARPRHHGPVGGRVSIVPVAVTALYRRSFPAFQATPKKGAA
jgi:hypothetical protein